MKPAPVVEWRCDTRGDACLIAAVYRTPSGAQVLFRRHRMSAASAAAVGREDRRPAAPEVAVPLAELHRRGSIGPLNCRHHVIVAASTADLQDDYDQAVAEGRMVPRFLRP